MKTTDFKVTVGRGLLKDSTLSLLIWTLNIAIWIYNSSRNSGAMYRHMDCFLGLWLVCMCTYVFNESRISLSPHSANTPSRFWEVWSNPSSAQVSKYSRMSCRFIVLYLIWMGWVCRHSHVQPAAAGHGTDVTSWIRPTESAAKLD